MTTRWLVIAGVASGVGKTTVTLGLLEAYRRRGLTVQAFKVGPDFIDPGFHEAVTGRPSHNLDGWMCGRRHVLETAARHTADADLAVVEGVMGCFDGYDGTSEDGSTAQIAKWLGAPIVLVVDARAQSRSAAAVVLGFERFDPEMRIAAVIFNRVASEVHARWLREAVATRCDALPVGALPRSESIVLPERHLGLVTAVEGALGAERRGHLADLVEASVDLGELLACAAPLELPEVAPAFPPASPVRARIGVARDAAFQFYYHENFALLEKAGARLVFWSPCTERDIPEADGLYFGGGYPELFAQRLSENESMRAAVRKFAESGRPVYAECGGLMYLAESLEDLGGVAYPMVGVLPAKVRMLPKRLSLGYTEVHLTAAAPIGSAGTAARGHEFHYSTLESVPGSVPRVYRLHRRRGDEREEGYLLDRTLMSYVHLHFASNPRIAEEFVGACISARR